ncbi:unnamed protein product [Phytophthora lilii]|uniref:Unnamed protein product n=1 Tax=Phytophthora lilii TaxID=2077276 RepID=A0A9W6TB30_9STRA|nr:unnamed protein product [Phytophthora lilii]
MYFQDLLKNSTMIRKNGFIGTQALYQKAKELDPKITIKIVKEWYANQTDIQRFQDQKKRVGGFKIASHNPNSCQFLSNKTAATVLAALKAFVHLHTANILTSDNGSEFMNSQAQVFFRTKRIEHYNNEPGDHETMITVESNDSTGP